MEDMNDETKFFFIESKKHVEKKVVSRINTNLTDKVNAHLNLDFDREDNWVERAFDDCTQYFLRFSYICVNVVELFQKKLENAYSSTLTDSFKNQKKLEKWE